MALSLAGLSLSAGCGEKAKPAAKAPVVDETAELEKALANFSPEDRALAMKQKVCPVTNEPLGSMGEPIKLEKDGKAIFICCAGCKKKVEANFAEYLAKIEGGEKPAVN